MAGVLVAALKEAFDRDSTRLEMERSQIEAERRRAEEALRAELRRQAGERALGQLRLIAVMAIGAWALSAVLSVDARHARRHSARAARLGLGPRIRGAGNGPGRLAADFIMGGGRGAGGTATGDTLHAPAAVAAPWLLIGALGLTAASLLAAL